MLDETESLPRLLRDDVVVLAVGLGVVLAVLAGLVTIGSSVTALTEGGFLMKGGSVGLTLIVCLTGGRRGLRDLELNKEANRGSE
jgi:hypothetical protein